eukprot:COSAG02_NODE_5832_length_4004_cov_2.835339_2_plen_62_part_00
MGAVATAITPDVSITRSAASTATRRRTAVSVSVGVVHGAAVSLRVGENTMSQQPHSHPQYA